MLYFPTFQCAMKVFFLVFTFFFLQVLYNKIITIWDTMTIYIFFLVPKFVTFLPNANGSWVFYYYFIFYYLWVLKRCHRGNFHDFKCRNNLIHGEFLYAVKIHRYFSNRFISGCIPRGRMSGRGKEVLILSTNWTFSFKKFKHLMIKWWALSIFLLKETQI